MDVRQDSEAAVAQARVDSNNDDSRRPPDKYGGVYLSEAQRRQNDRLLVATIHAKISVSS